MPRARAPARFAASLTAGLLPGESDAALRLPNLFFMPAAAVLLVCTAQAIAFVRLLDAPSTPRAALWVGLAGLAILTHYCATFRAAAQGLSRPTWRIRIGS